jgi:hypothetical protein
MLAYCYVARSTHGDHAPHHLEEGGRQVAQRWYEGGGEYLGGVISHGQLACYG